MASSDLTLKIDKNSSYRDKKSWLSLDLSLSRSKSGSCFCGSFCCGCSCCCCLGAATVGRLAGSVLSRVPLMVAALSCSKNSSLASDRAFNSSMNSLATLGSTGTAVVVVGTSFFVAVLLLLLLLDALASASATSVLTTSPTVSMRRSVSCSTFSSSFSS